MPPRRPVGLIALVLIVDLGLAAAGAALLMKGLAAKQTSETKAAPPAETANERKTEAQPAAASDGIAAAPVADSIGAVADTGAVTPVAAVAAAAATSDRAATEAASEARTATTRDTVAARTASTKSSAAKAKASAAAPAAPAAASTAAAVASRSTASSTGASAASKSTVASTSAASAGASAAGKPSASTSSTSSGGASAAGKPEASADATRVTAVPSAPQDPYPDPEREIDAAAARSKAAFARCAADHGPAHGAIQIAFQVRADGRIANAAAVENSTGNSELARCLVAEIASWRVSAHGGATIDMFRPFTYP